MFLGHIESDQWQLMIPQTFHTQDPQNLSLTESSTHLGLHASAVHAFGSNHYPLPQEDPPIWRATSFPSAPASPTTKLSTAVTCLPFSSRMNSLWPHHPCTCRTLSCLLCGHQLFIHLSLPLDPTFLTLWWVTSPNTVSQNSKDSIMNLPYESMTVVNSHRSWRSAFPTEP